MQIKTALRFHLTLVRVAVVRKEYDKKGWPRGGERGALIHCWWAVNGAATVEISVEASQWAEKRMALWPAIPLLGL